MRFIAENDLIHGDVKPCNILVSSRKGRLRAFIGDFGLTNKSGGTPIFMAPEGLRKESRVVAKTDLYSFAITTLFLLFRTDFAFKLLFLPVSQGVEKFRKTLHKFSLLNLIFDTLNLDSGKRIDFDQWKEMLESSEESWFTTKISSEILEDHGVDLEPFTFAEEREMGMVYYMAQYFHLGSLKERGSSLVNESEAWKMSEAVSHFQNLSLEALNRTSNLLSRGFCFII